MDERQVKHQFPTDHLHLNTISSHKDLKSYVIKGVEIDIKEKSNSVFVSKTSFADKIYIVDNETGKAFQELEFPEFDAIFEIDISNDGNKIVFAGQKNLKSDIYIYDLVTEEITAITDGTA